MNETDGDHLYKLLPAVYRLRDFAQGEPLRALLAVIESELQLVQSDIDDLYENWFIETCADWVIPYIGDLVGNKPLHEIRQLRRTDVAKTIYYRRRKGTLAMLEELARNVTGWGAHAVEFFNLLGWTQHLNHLRFRMAANPDRRFPNAVDRVGTVNLRSGDVVDRLDGPFDIISHTVDVRPITSTAGWYNIRKIGFFLWRLRHYPLSGIKPRRSPGHSYGYHFGPLSNPAPLFNNPQHEADDAGLAGEIHVPGPVRPAAFHADLERYQEKYASVPLHKRPVHSDYYGPGRSLNVVKDDVPVSPMDVMCKDLRHWDRPPGGKVAIDVRVGRLTFAPGEEPTQLKVDYTYGFSSDIGGGPYTRRQSLADPRQTTLQIVVAKGTPTNTIQKALQQWANQGKPPCIIQITDSDVYGGNVDVELPPRGWLALEAADGKRPVVRLVGTASIVAPAEGATLIVNGLLVEGGFELHGGLDLAIQHCTLVPGRTLTEGGDPAFPDRDSLVVGTASDDLTVTISKSIVGPLRLPTNSKQLAVQDGIVHAPAVGGAARPAIAADDAGAQPGPPATLERVTVWGSVYVKELTLVSEVIFTASVRAQRQQVGCVRFSYVPSGSPTPRRYRCQPDLALVRRAQEKGLDSAAQLSQAERDLVLARVKPEFTSERYGDPGYAQLGLNCAEEIRIGAEDGSEMGVFSDLKQPQRVANLRLRLDEYLPFGLEAGFIYVT